MTEHWTHLTGALARLEDCASLGGYATVNAVEAQALLDEIWHLRLGNNNQFATAGSMPLTNLPPAPAHEGAQFEDRHGHVWTWTDFWRLDISGTARDCLVREDDDQDIIATWPDAWIEHGPLWPIGSAPAYDQTVLRARLIVNGHRGEFRTTVDDWHWDQLGEEYRAVVKADVARRLVDGVVSGLNVPVSVQRAPRWIREAEAGVRNRYPREAGPET